MSQPPDPLYTYRGEMKAVNCLLVAIKDQQELLYVGTVSGDVHIWDIKLNRELKKIKVSENACLSIAVTTEYVITQEKGGAIKIWLHKDPEWECFKEINQDYVGFCKMHFEGRLFYPHQGGKVKVHNLDTGKESEIYYKYNKHHGEVMSILYLKTLDRILILFEAGLLSIWKMDGLLVSEIILKDTPMAMAFCEKTLEGVVGTSGHLLTKFIYKDQELLMTRETSLTNPGVSSVAIRDDGKLCAVGCWDGRIRYFTMSLRLLAVLDHHKETLQAVLFCDKVLGNWGNRILFAGGADGRVSLWGLYSQSSKDDDEIN